MSNLYFWKDGEVLVLPSNPSTFRPPIEYCDLLCVDTDHQTPAYRYGMYISDGWCPIPYKEFPKEFKVHLLLLGVPVNE